MSIQEAAKETTFPVTAKHPLARCIEALGIATNETYSAWIEPGNDWRVYGDQIRKIGPSYVIQINSLPVIQNALEAAGLSPDLLTVQVGNDPPISAPTAEQLHGWTNTAISFPKRLAYDPAFVAGLTGQFVKDTSTVLEIKLTGPRRAIILAAGLNVIGLKRRVAALSGFWK